MLISEFIVEATDTGQTVTTIFELSTALAKNWRRVRSSEFVSTVTEIKSSSAEQGSCSLVSGCKTVELSKKEEMY